MGRIKIKHHTIPGRLFAYLLAYLFVLSLLLPQQAPRNLTPNRLEKERQAGTPSRPRALDERMGQKARKRAELKKGLARCENETKRNKRGAIRCVRRLPSPWDEAKM